MPYGHMDRYSDAVYRIEGGVFIREHEGKYGAYDNTNPASAYSYEWDGKAVSESEYQSLLSEAVDTRGAVNMTDRRHVGAGGYGAAACGRSGHRDNDIYRRRCWRLVPECGGICG